MRKESSQVHINIKKLISEGYRLSRTEKRLIFQVKGKKNGGDGG